MPLVGGKGFPKLKSKPLVPIQIDTFQGVNVLVSVTRLQPNEAREALNMMLIEDSIWDKRWGTKTQITMGSNIDGFSEFVKSDLTRELIIVAGGTVYKSTDMATTSSISGATLTAGKQCFFVQMGSFLYITNGVDAMVRYDGTTLTQYTALGAVGTVTPTRGAGLSSGSFNYYYKVTAINAVGETAPSAEATIGVNVGRSLWASGTNQNIALAWTAVTSAVAYVVYMSDTGGFEAKLDTVTSNSYTDYGTTVSNPYIGPPNADSTGGPKLKYTWISGNRIWGTDPNFPYRVWFSGAGTFIGNFNTFYGGGWLEFEKGGRATVTAGKEFQGHSYVICQTPDGLGSIFYVDLISQSVSGSSTSYIVPVPTKVVGGFGSQSERSVVLVQNDLWFFNKNGYYVAGNEPQFYNLVRANEISTKLRPYLRGLSQDSIGKVCAYYFDAKVFISVPTASGDPNRICIYDREKLQWEKDWTIGVTQFGQFTTSDSTTHFLGSTGTKIIEFSTAYPDDDGVAFTWRYTSPQMPVNQQWTQFMKVKKAYVRLRNATGTVNFSFSGTRKTTPFSQLKSAGITAGTSDTGMGWDAIGTVAIGSTAGKPTFFLTESLIKFMKINKLLRDIQWQISGSSSNDRAVITGLMAKGFPLNAGDPNAWKLS